MKNLLLVKVKAVLEAIAAAPQPTALNELAKSLNLPLPTLSRITADLVEMGLVDKIDYHHLAPGLGMLRLGECARQNIPLIQQVVPLCQRFAAQYGNISFIIAAISGNSIFQIYSSNPAFSDSAILWSSGIATVLLAASGKDLSQAQQCYLQKFPQAEIAEKLIFEREFESVLQKKHLFRISTMRLWSLSMPFNYHNNSCGVSFFGNAPKDTSPERFIFECAKLIAKLNSLTDVNE